MARTVSHKAETLEMRDHVNCIPEEVSSCDSKESPSPFVPSKRTIRGQGRRTEALDSQGNHNQYVGHRYATAIPELRIIGIDQCSETKREPNVEDISTRNRDMRPPHDSKERLHTTCFWSLHREPRKSD